MKLEDDQRARLQFLSRVTQKECLYLQETDRRLFADPIKPEDLEVIEMDPLLSERLDAFVSRFGRLQDNLGDKLLPQLLNAMAEKTGAAIENLDRAEKLGWIDSANAWLEIRKLRNQMVHEYIDDTEDLQILMNALTSGHTFVPVLIKTAKRLTDEVSKLTR